MLHNSPVLCKENVKTISTNDISDHICINIKEKYLNLTRIQMYTSGERKEKNNFCVIQNTLPDNIICVLFEVHFQKHVRFFFFCLLCKNCDLKLTIKD